MADVKNAAFKWMKEESPTRKILSKASPHGRKRAYSIDETKA